MRQWLIAVLVLLVLSAHAQGDDSVRLEDARGVEVVLDKPAARVISLAPHITEIVYAAGAGDQLVGAVSYSDYPEAAKAVPRVGSYDNVNYEAVVSLAPDLVLAWRSGNGEEVARRLESFGLTVYVTEPRVLENVATSLRHFGLLTGHREQGEEQAGQFLANLTRLREHYSRQQPISVYYQVWNEPMMTLNGEHLISDVLRLCGARNVFSDAQPMVLRISVESVIRADPQVIIASGMGEARPEWLDDWRIWTDMQAVRNQQLYFVPPELLQRHTPRIIQGAEQVCHFVEKARRHYGSVVNADQTE